MRIRDEPVVHDQDLGATVADNVNQNLGYATYLDGTNLAEA
jgi:hypothetical protein